MAARLIKLCRYYLHFFRIGSIEVLPEQQVNWDTFVDYLASYVISRNIKDNGLPENAAEELHTKLFYSRCDITDQTFKDIKELFGTFDVSQEDNISDAEWFAKLGSPLLDKAVEVFEEELK